jgi:hypothetical protein
LIAAPASGIYRNSDAGRAIFLPPSPNRAKFLILEIKSAPIRIASIEQKNPQFRRKQSKISTAFVDSSQHCHTDSFPTPVSRCSSSLLNETKAMDRPKGWPIKELKSS